MFPLGQKLQDRLLSPVPRSRRASASASTSDNERAHRVENPTGTGTRDPQRKARPLSVPLFSPGSGTYAYAEVSPQKQALGDLGHRPSGAASLLWTSSNLKTTQFVANGHNKDVKDATITGRTTDKIEQTRDRFVKQGDVQPDSSTFTAVVFAQRWLGKLRLQDPHPITRKLQQASQTSYNGQKFIPETQIREIVRDEVIQAELFKANSKPSRILKAPVVSQDYASYRKILAILYLMKRPSKIRRFVKAGLCDDYLPFKKAQHPGRFDRSAKLTGQNTPGCPCMKFTRPEDADEFLELQWSVLAPIFVRSDGTVPHNDFEYDSILPFLPETTIAKEGGSSKVYKVKIHSDHHNLCQMNGGSDIYAVKTLKSKDDVAFHQEVTVLRRLSTSKHTHPHLITLLATYKRRTTYHLIFPWADADLFDYWKRRQEAPPEDGLIGKWVIEQCRGLADGLNSVHRYATFSGTSILDAFKLPSTNETDGRHQSTHGSGVNVNRSARNLFGRHGDLKPKNILWYPDPKTTGGHGILKITDFGVTRFNTEDMWDTQKTGKLPNSPSYRSPENDLDGKLTTACDVWALGCVYLEFVAWYCGGYRLVQRFGEQRLAPDPRMANMRTDTFFTIVEKEGEKTAVVKPAVLKVIEELREHHRCRGDYNDFLDMIKDDMLVAHSPDVPDSGDGSLILRKSVSEPVGGAPRLGYIRRKSCGDVFRRLGDINPRSDQEEPASPIAQSHHTWPQWEP